MVPQCLGRFECRGAFASNDRLYERLAHRQVGIRSDAHAGDCSGWYTAVTGSTVTHCWSAGRDDGFVLQIANAEGIREIRTKFLIEASGTNPAWLAGWVRKE